MSVRVYRQKICNKYSYKKICKREAVGFYYFIQIQFDFFLEFRGVGTFGEVIFEILIDLNNVISGRRFIGL